MLHELELGIHKSNIEHVRMAKIFGLDFKDPIYNIRKKNKLKSKEVMEKTTQVIKNEKTKEIKKKLKNFLREQI